ncbi:MAG: site-specific integrase [bacterium]
MATIIMLRQDLRQVSKNDTYPIRLVLNFKGKRSYITIEKGPSVPSRYWSQETGRITKGANLMPSPSYWNDYLAEKLDAAQKIIDKAFNEGTLMAYTHEELRTRLKKGKAVEVSFTAYIDNLIEEFGSSGNDGQKRIYTQARRFLAKYSDLPQNGYAFKEVNYRLLRLMEERFIPRIPGNLNGLGICLRTIRAVWNRAIAEGVTSDDAYPFKKYSIKRSKTHKSAITVKDFEAIASIDLPVNSMAWHGRNMFFFSFQCRGMNFADIAALRYSCLKGDRIVYVRKKVGKAQTIKISEAIQEILDLYARAGAKPTDYIFPVVENALRSESYYAIKYLSSVNHALKRWALTLGLHDSLSFNTARHSWATIGRNMNLPIAVISQGLGHADIETTQIYLDEFETSVMDNASQVVGGGVRLKAQLAKPL